MTNVRFCQNYLKPEIIRLLLVKQEFQNGCSCSIFVLYYKKIYWKNYKKKMLFKRFAYVKNLNYFFIEPNANKNVEVKNVRMTMILWNVAFIFLWLFQFNRINLIAQFFCHKTRHFNCLTVYNLVDFPNKLTEFVV